jgi:hypothetical protein
MGCLRRVADLGTHTGAHPCLFGEPGGPASKKPAAGLRIDDHPLPDARLAFPALVLGWASAVSSITARGGRASVGQSQSAKQGNSDEGETDQGRSVLPSISKQNTSARTAIGRSTLLLQARSDSGWPDLFGRAEVGVWRSESETKGTKCSASEASDALSSIAAAEQDPDGYARARFSALLPTGERIEAREQKEIDRLFHFWEIDRIDG